MQSKVILITGPSASGKSTVANILANSQASTWALISQDDVRSQVKSGYSSPIEKWDDETKRQWNTSVDICCDMVKRYQQTGINCILEMFAPASEFQPWQATWQEKLKDVHYQLFVLLPDAKTTVARHRHRNGTMTEERIRQNHKLFTGWKDNSAVVIDSSKQTMQETAATIERQINR